MPWSVYLLLSSAPAQASGSGALGASLSLAWTLPFVGMLLSIALLPMVAGHWWEHRRNQLLVSGLWSLPILGLLGWLMATGADAELARNSLLHALEEYISFIVLLASLFVISGGVLLKGDLRATPLTNTLFLGIGAVLANLVGTTGASMLLIRPLLRTNAQRQFVRHIPIFFIFLVSNIGGALTPVGDPPLFLGYLRGVPFFWTLRELWALWALPVAILLVVFFVLDTWFAAKESVQDRARDEERVQPLAVEGGGNLLLLGGVIAAVLLLSPDPEVHDLRHYYLRELAMVGLAGLSLWRTSPTVRKANAFSFGPIQEVAALFIGIFVTMIPATMILQARGPSLGITEPWQYFWATGALSSFLDNAPTYVTFAAMACGSVPDCSSPEQLGSLAASAQGGPLLVAISAGAVFMGANSYIGNGPNFMVRAIAEESGYRMPSFFGYIAWALAFLIPTFLVVSLVFFS